MTDNSTGQWEKAFDLGRQMITNCFRQWEQKVPRPLIGLFIALLGNFPSNRSFVEGYMEERDLDQEYLFSAVRGGRVGEGSGCRRRPGPG